MLIVVESIPREHCLARARFWSTDAEVTVFGGMVILSAEVVASLLAVVMTVECSAKEKMGSIDAGDAGGGLLAVHL